MLYKYLPQNIINKLLENLSVRFTQPLSLNGPFALVVKCVWTFRCIFLVAAIIITPEFEIRLQPICVQN